MEEENLNIKLITEGYYNLLKSKIKISKKDIEDLSTYRLSICAACEDFREDNTCSNCGCNMNAKSRARSARCPIGKW